MFSQRISAITLVLAATFLLAACGESEGDGGTGPGPTPTIAINIAPTAISVMQGASGSVAATITRSGGFSGTVAIVSLGAPSNVQATAAAGATTNGVTTGTVTIDVGPSVAPGTYPILVRATGSGVSAVEQTFMLTVLARPGFSLALVPAAISVERNAAGATQINATRVNLTEAIALSATGLPTGVSVAFAPPSMTGATSTATFTVTPATPLGTHQITITGSATGATSQNAVLALTVIAPANPDYSLRVTPGDPMTLTQGSAKDVVVNIDRVGGLSANVALSVVSAPVGLNATLSPTNTNGNSVALNVAAPGNLALGTYQLTINGSATGLPARMTTLTVNVTAASSGSININFASCSAGSRPVWLAVQDGIGGTWTRVLPTNDVYNVDVTQSKAGLAYVTQDMGLTETRVMYMSRPELVAYAAALPCSVVGKTITGTVINVAFPRIVMTSLGGATDRAPRRTGSTNAFSLIGVAAGQHDFVGYMGRLGFPEVGDRLMIRRDQDIANGGVMSPIDATGPESHTPLSAVFTVNALIAGESLNHGMQYVTGSACTHAYMYDGGATGNTFTAWGMPSAPQRPTDLHAVRATAEALGGNTRSVVTYFKNMAPRTLNLPPQLPAPAVVNVTAPYRRLGFSYVAPSTYDGMAMATYTGASTKVTLSASVLGYIGSSAVNLTTPEFGAGYDPAWAPSAAELVGWTVEGSGTNNLASCSEGSESWSAVKRGTR